MTNSGRLMEDWRTWAPQGRQLLTGGISDAAGGFTGSSMSDEDQDRALSSD